MLKFLLVEMYKNMSGLFRDF